MIRILLENALLFLLPSMIYLTWVMLARTGRPAGGGTGGVGAGKALDGAPVLWLFAAGALLVLATLLFFGSTEGGKPGQHYEPATLDQGKVNPSHFD